MEDELLCDAWLAVSVDFVGKSKEGPSGSKCMKTFTQESILHPRTCTSFNKRNVRSSSYHMYAI